MPSDHLLIQTEILKLPPEMQNLLYACARTLAAKGADYAHEQDRLANFNEGATYLGLNPEQVWGVYVWKHVASIFKYCRSLKNESEPTWKRVMDVVVYLLLFVLFLKKRDQALPPEPGSYDVGKDS